MIVTENIDTNDVLKTQKRLLIETKLKQESEYEKKIRIDDLPNLKTSEATIRAALVRKGVYLPYHNKHKTSLWYMKNIISGNKDFLKTGAIQFVDVPQFDELKPENFLK